MVHREKVYLIGFSSFSSAGPRTPGEPWAIPILENVRLDIVPSVHTKPWNIGSIA